MFKKIALSVSAFVLLIGGSGAWLFSLLEGEAAREGLDKSQPQDISYIADAPLPTRGKILAVVTSTNVLGDTGKYTGYELTELARAYYVFAANGFEVDVASPRGGEPPAVIDTDDMGAMDYAFLNDEAAQRKVKNSMLLETVGPDAYRAVFFVGGKGAMFDFPNNPHIQTLAADFYESGKVIAAVCHGPAALVNVTLSTGQPLLAGKAVTGFTNEEERFLLPDAETIFPFLLQDGMAAQGARFIAGEMYLEQIAQDRNLITGQNPWSVWTTAERVVSGLGYTPVDRPVTAEEQSVAVLKTYETLGYERAEAQLKALVAESPTSIQRNLIAIHGLVAAMQGRLKKSVDLVRLVRLAKSYQNVE